MIERGIGSETGVDWKIKNEYTYRYTRKHGQIICI